jgi:hypothetical protein
MIEEPAANMWQAFVFKGDGSMRCIAAASCGRNEAQNRIPKITVIRKFD